MLPKQLADGVTRVCVFWGPLPLSPPHVCPAQQPFPGTVAEPGAATVLSLSLKPVQVADAKKTHPRSQARPPFSPPRVILFTEHLHSAGWACALFICPREVPCLTAERRKQVVPLAAFTNLAKVLGCCPPSAYTMTCKSMTVPPGAARAWPETPGVVFFPPSRAGG